MQPLVQVLDENEKVMLDRIQFKYEEFDYLLDKYVLTMQVNLAPLEITIDIYNLVWQYVTAKALFDDYRVSPENEMKYAQRLLLWDRLLTDAKFLFKIYYEMQEKTDTEEDLVTLFIPFIRPLSLGYFGMLAVLEPLRTDEDVEEFTRQELTPNFLNQEYLNMIRQGKYIPTYNNTVNSDDILLWPHMKEFTHECMKCLKQI